MPAFTPRTKKFIGAMIMLIWLVVYAFLVMSIGVLILPHAYWLVTLLFYAVAGTAWAIPIGLMLPWMHRDPNA